MSGPQGAPAAQRAQVSDWVGTNGTQRGRPSEGTPPLQQDPELSLERAQGPGCLPGRNSTVGMVRTLPGSRESLPGRSTHHVIDLSSSSKMEIALSFFSNQRPKLILIVSDAASHRAGDFRNVSRLLWMALGFALTVYNIGKCLFSGSGVLTVRLFVTQILAVRCICTLRLS